MTRHILLFAFLLLTANSWAQEKICTVDLPAGLIDRNGALLEGLTAKDLTVRIGKQSVPVADAKYDTGPRRILFILDTSKRLVPEIRKIQPMLVDYILSNARPGDSFALVTVRGTVRQVHFGESKEALLKAVQELATDPKEPGKARNILDVILESVSWFGEPRDGDAMFVLANHLEENGEPDNNYSSRQLGGNGPLQGVARNDEPSFESPSKAKFSAVANALAAHRVRVFGAQIGDLRTNAAITARFTPNDENLFGISLGSGGYAFLDSPDSFGSYVLTEDRLARVKKNAWQVYGAISQFYVLQVKPPGPISGRPWKLELAPDLRNNTRIIYPEHFDPCSATEPH